MKMSPGINQFLVAGSTYLIGISAGATVGYPSVLLNQLRANDSSINLNLETSSWMGSIHGLAGILSILMPTIMQWRGRKFAFISTSVIIIIGWLLSYFATDVITLLLGECFHGLGGHSLAFVSYSIINEMITTKLKNVGMLIYAITMYLGIVLINILDRLLYWKTISVMMIAPVLVAALMACLWPESPPWLACKGEFNKCEKAFVSLRGTDEHSKKELYNLIAAQKEMLQNGKSNIKREMSFKSFWWKVTSRDFYWPSLHMFVLLMMIYWSGFMVLLIYATQMIEKTTKNENAAFIGSIITNSILFICIVISTILTKFFNNKPLLLLSSGGTAVSLFCACTVTYLQGVDVLPKDSLLCFYCLIAYMIAASLGLSSIAYTVAAEIMPVKHRGVGGALYTIYTCILHTSSMKLAPYLFLYIDLWGSFLIYMLNAIICCLYVWKFVPETKDRTLQELEDYFMYGQFHKTSAIEDYSVTIPVVK